MEYIEASVCLHSTFLPEDISVRIVHRFLFIEARKKEGVKGVNLATFTFKKCIKLSKNTDLDEIMAYYCQNMVRIGTSEKTETEIIIPIDKSLARNLEPKRWIPVSKKPRMENAEEAFYNALAVIFQS